MSRPIEESEMLEGLSVAPLKAIGLWRAINTYLSSGQRTWGLKLLTAWSIFYALPYVSFQLLSVFFISLDLEKLTFLCFNCVPCIQVFVKVGVFWHRLDAQCDIYRLVRQDYLKSIPQHKMNRTAQIYKKTARLCNLYSIMAFAGMIMCVTSWIVVPGIDAIDMTGARSTKVLGGWYPFAFSQYPWYLVVLCYETVLMASHGLLISFFECVMILPLLSLCAHFEVLGYHISTLRVSDAILGKVPQDGTEYLTGELEAIMIDYKELLRCTAVIQDILNLLVTVILGTGIVVLIVGILQFMFESKDFIFVFHFVTYLSYEATEVFLICVCSTTLQTVSGDIRFALYSSDWYLADKKYAKTAQMMMLRALKPITLTAIKMYPVSVDILVGIFQFTYTAAMVLSK